MVREQLVGGLWETPIVHRHGCPEGLVEELCLWQGLAIVSKGVAVRQVLFQRTFHIAARVARGVEVGGREAAAPTELGNQALVRVAEDAEDGFVPEDLAGLILRPMLRRCIHELATGDRRLLVSQALGGGAEAGAAIAPLDALLCSDCCDCVPEVVRHVRHGQVTLALKGPLLGDGTLQQEKSVLRGGGCCPGDGQEEERRTSTDGLALVAACQQRHASPL
mmetsp:Transcript_32560/g.89825  ORF Transcript_32560/g.89825 Transcript_32560/m.89825 type:complete len:221 (+) Transcript_32560:315-977(+)|eukprot:CAMPEP_0179048286 /NCGR_PEP_ID=MMETSP0796-20121207/19633_1 /TAXON_ID=73915 /ORGANISM="Pyrodinium bahamense, Strain pbaha01" /LENGTH=220 /DNA_ID=CAMNT_0020744755 /DNA_START=316 /DNA_END=978 /DNA_ORIENTATION=-